MKTIDFLGFRFGKIHTSDLNLVVVSTSDRYEERMLPNPNDVTQDITGSDGQYYFGQTYKNREITCNIAFDNVSESIYRKIRQLFSTDKLQDLVFDEEPYKTWRAKLKSKPDFKSLCFMDKETGQRVYKGDGKLTFICYYPYAFGFDKYIVRAADYYMLNPPECIIKESYSDDTYVKNSKEKKKEDFLSQDIKYHYNVNPSDYNGGDTVENIENNFYRDKSHRNKQGRYWEPNDKEVWKTGFPNYDQVSAGELFFDTPQGEKTIVDVRNYWDNIPEWQETAKLLTTPTLDYDQELMYLPQYSKVDFINMETGFDSSKSMIGSRMLVYNPGDLPVEWEIKLNENKRAFWSSRGGKFRIRRFNVERLELENAVDWCGLKTYREEDNDYFKYGNKYFKRRRFSIDRLINKIENCSEEDLPKIVRSVEDWINDTDIYYTRQELINKLKLGIIPFDKQWDEVDEQGQEIINKYSTTIDTMYKYAVKESGDLAFNTHINDSWKNFISETDNTAMPLGEAHPHHCYYVEPIPKEKLGKYIKLFYWQTIQWRGDQLPDGTWAANERYKEMIKDCFDEYGHIKEEQNALIQMAKMFANIVVDEKGNKYLETKNDNTYREVYKNLDFEDGIEFANRYEEMYSECINDEERYELYWDTLKKLLEKFEPMLKRVNEEETSYEAVMLDIRSTDVKDMIEHFIYSYINNPLEFIGTDLRDLDYDNEVFNGYKYPYWITEDYIEIDANLLSGVDIVNQFLAAMEEDDGQIFTGMRRQYTEEDKAFLIKKGKYAKLISTLEKTIGINGFLNDLLDDYYYINSDKRVLYTTANPYGMEFVYKPNKVIMNNAITKGHWFKLPPGWSLICVEPVVDETTWGGKRWRDGRPYDWGYGGDRNKNKREVQQLYDYINELSKNEFFDIYPKEDILNRIVSPKNIMNYTTTIENNDTDELIKFKIWYEQQLYYHIKNTKNYFAISMYQKYRVDAEYEFLKIVHSIWTAFSKYYKWSSGKGVFIDPDTHEQLTLDDYDMQGRPLRCINGDISDWWWYACNYLWANFPPLYWAAADMLNNINIKYIPLFY